MKFDLTLCLASAVFLALGAFAVAAGSSIVVMVPAASAVGLCVLNLLEGWR